ncbi:MAG: hypothetical protein JST52_12145, partial [Bacteroidetes bacterium]|nr:hypothetical protein [Bacteroidota bacterium]
ARIRLVGTFGEPTVTEDFLRVTGFNSNETWKIFKKGGQYGTTAYDNLLGAPEVLTAAINHDLPVPTNGFIVNISDYPQPWNYLNPPAHYLPSTFGAPANPMYLADSVYWKNTLMHLVYYGTIHHP